MNKRFQRSPIQKGDLLTSSSAAKVQAALQNVVALHQRGLLEQAEEIYRDIRKCAPANFDATHLLGVLLLQRRQFVEAEQLIAEALRINPSAPASYDRAIASRTSRKRVSSLFPRPSPREARTLCETGVAQRARVIGAGEC